MVCYVFGYQIVCDVVDVGDVEDFVDFGIVDEVFVYFC